MRFVVRPDGSEPSALKKPGKAIRDERKAATRYYFKADPADPKFKSFKFDAYRDRAVADALAVIFERKCAYCERDVRAGGDAEIEHFRPKGGVESEIHPGYWWLAHTWLNMLPSCQACNQRRLVNVLEQAVTPEEFERLLNARPRESHGKQNYFPIAGTRAVHRKHDLAGEVPLLIDPTVTDPALHLEWRHEGNLSLVHPRSVGGVPDPMGRESIKAFALNRVPLVARRNAVLKFLRLQRARIMTRLVRMSPDEEDWLLVLAAARSDAEFMRSTIEDDQEFTAMARAFVDDFERELDEMEQTA